MTARIELDLVCRDSEEKISLRFEYSKELVGKLKLVPFTYWSGTMRVWTMPFKLSVLLVFIKVATRNNWKLIIKNRKIQELLDSQGTPHSKKSGPPRPPEKTADHELTRVRKNLSESVMLGDAIIKDLQKFEKFMYQRRYSQATIRVYSMAVKHFFISFPGKSWKEISLSDIEEYNYHNFILAKASNSSQNQFISALKLFFRLFDRMDIIPEDIQRPFSHKSLPNVLTKEEVRNIILACGNIKHKCLISLVYGAGLRIGEALNLKLSDIRRKEQLLYIRSGKGNKDRRVPLSEPMLKLIEEYWYAYRTKEYLFEGQYGGKYSYTSSQKIFRRAVRKAGIRMRVTLHTLRHSYATHLLESGVGLRYIQELLGHNSPKTTMIYTHVSGKKLSEVRSPFDDLDI